MTTIRTKLSAFAPVFVEVLEELEREIQRQERNSIKLEQRVSIAEDTLRADAEDTELRERIEALENGQLGAKADVVLELHKRCNDAFRRIRETEDELQRVSTKLDDKALARIEALEHAVAPKVDDFLIHDGEKIHALTGKPEAIKALHRYIASGNGAEHVRELVLAARALYNDTYESRGSWVIESADQLTALGMALKHFEGIK